MTWYLPFKISIAKTDVFAIECLDQPVLGATAYYRRTIVSRFILLSRVSRSNLDQWVSLTAFWQSWQWALPYNSCFRIDVISHISMNNMFAIIHVYDSLRCLTCCEINTDHAVPVLLEHLTATSSIFRWWPLAFPNDLDLVKYTWSSKNINASCMQNKHRNISKRY